ncbi:MAG: hypothetical protein KAY12_01530, partial [Arenimonas sp.]|nr:hypothetical protein [Arenimonas sp.]
MPATDALFQVLEPLRLRYLESPLPIWLRTAGDALFAALPARLRRQLGMRYRRLLLSMDGNALQLRALLDDQSSLLGTVPLDDATLLQQLRMRLDESAGGVPRWLLIESRLALRPVLAAPASAEPRLREMMAHEIDRQTLFTLQQVTFAPRVLSRD